MTDQTVDAEGAEARREKTYYVDLEGVGVKEWHQPEITVPQIRELAGWDTTQPVIEVNLETNTDTTLAEDAVVTLKPGHGFAKKVKFKRG